MVLIEAWRQSVICIAHTRYKVPLDYKFTLQSLTVDMVPGALSTLPGHPADVEIHVRTADLCERDEIVTALHVEATIYSGEAMIGTAACETRILPPAVYTALRCKGGLPVTSDQCRIPHKRARISIREAGVRDRADVVLYADGTSDSRMDRWELVVDPNHPIFFDHRLDHVPGMLILEGFRQGVRLLAGDGAAQLDGLSASFRAFADLDRPTLISVQRTPEPRRFSAECLQDGRVLASATLHSSCLDPVEPTQSRDSLNKA